MIHAIEKAVAAECVLRMTEEQKAEAKAKMMAAAKAAREAKKAA